MPKAMVGLSAVYKTSARDCSRKGGLDYRGKAKATNRSYNSPSPERTEARGSLQPAETGVLQRRRINLWVEVAKVRWLRDCTVRSTL